MGFFDSKTYTTSTSYQEDSRVAAENSRINQLREIQGDVIFTDPGAFALGEKSLEFASGAFRSSLEAQSANLEAGRGELDKVLSKILGAAVPIAVVGLIAYAVKK